MAAATMSYSTTPPYTQSAYAMDSTLRQLSPEELNSAALDSFVYTPVDRKMIRHLARRTNQVLSCDGAAEVSSTPDASIDEGPIPTLEEFITQLVVCSNVQVPTLMSTLVYLTRLKARLQPQAKGRRSTPHRIFLATLILAAKYLNDSSPKNKHWARYTAVAVVDPRGGARGDFRFRTAEVNEMERQLLYLLDFDLRIEAVHLYNELEPFLAPICEGIAEDYAQRQLRKIEARMRSQSVANPTPAVPSYSETDSSSSSSDSPHPSVESSSSSSGDSPYAPSLTYSSDSNDSPNTSVSSRATTPDENAAASAYVYVHDGSDGSYENVDLAEPTKLKAHPTEPLARGPGSDKKTIRERLAAAFHHRAAY